MRYKYIVGTAMYPINIRTINVVRELTLFMKLFNNKCLAFSL